MPSHSGYPERGRSAISAMTALLSELEQIDFPSSNIIGPSTFHCGQISGGVGYNILASQCTAVCSVRVAQDLPKIEQLIDDAVSLYENIELKKKKSYIRSFIWIMTFQGWVPFQSHSGLTRRG